MKLIGGFDGEQLRAMFSARGAWADFGVPRSPRWVEPDDVGIDHLEILGVEVEPKDLPADLRAAVMALADEVEFRAGGE